MIINRYIEDKLISNLKPNKVLVLTGPRRIGKTELLKKISAKVSEKIFFLNGDDIETHNLLAHRSTENYKRILGGISLLIIDEAQEITDIGKKLKLMVDTIDNLKIIISGSSAFEINNQVGEPLVGRMSVFKLYPIAQMEFQPYENQLETRANLEHRLIYGSFPELIHLNSNVEKEKYLKDIVYSYLLKDILAFEGIKKRDKILSLLQLIAYRSGSEISLEGLGNELQISKNTVEKYMDLFSKVFILYPVSGFSRNADNEITKKKKWYFVDNGIRNALINQFNPLSLRDDVGKLWESYLNIERIKKLDYNGNSVSDYFWRTTTKQEIDRIEERNGQIEAFEYKWRTQKSSVPSQFAKNYPEAKYTVVTQDNYLDYIC
jgi:predicted AAA+ superfamily ATPase